MDKQNINIEIKAIKKFRKINGKYVENLWNADPKWVDDYKKIKYSGNPLDKTIQKRVHKIYNSLTSELQNEWLQKTSGLGWSDEYINIALTYWDKQEDYNDIVKKNVDEYMLTLTPLQKDNFKDICDIFCKENPYIHIKNSCGYLEYCSNKQSINEYKSNASIDEIDQITDLIHDMEWSDEYYFMLTYIRIQTVLNKYKKDDINSEYKYLTKKIKNLDWQDKLEFVINYDKSIQFWKDTKNKINKNKIKYINTNDADEIDKLLESLKFTKSKQFLEHLEKILDYMKSLNAKHLTDLKESIQELDTYNKYMTILEGDGFKEYIEKQN